MNRGTSARAGGWVVGLTAGAAALHWAGGCGLGGPPMADPGRWPAWLDQRGPVVAAFSLLRLVALAGLWYLVLATAVGLLVRAVGAASLVPVADRFTVAPLRRLLAGVGLSLAATTAVTAAAPAAMLPAAVAGQAGPVTTVPTTTDVPMTTDGAATVTMHRLSPADVAPAPPSPAADQAGAPAGNHWTVEPGQCFWSIAESVLTTAAGRVPTDAEIVPYWKRLIAANERGLAHPGDPDLIFPGQVFEVPAP